MSLFSWVQDQIKKAYAPLAETYSKHLMEQLLEPMNIIDEQVTIDMDDGSTATFQVFRSQHCNIKWPYKGWIRFHENVSLDEVKSLSAWMSFKTAVVDLPLGWGKWWIIVNPKELSPTELEKLSRAYIDAIWKHIWPTRDVPAPDVNTNGQIMAWMADQYAKHVGERQPGVITGKPLSIGWSKWRSIATAQWWLYVLRRFLRHKNDSLKGKRIVIQWAWNAWLTFAQLAKEDGAIIVGISDSGWGIHLKEWLSIRKLKAIKSDRKSVTTYDAWTVVWHGDILTIDCDILVPAALENQITEQNANDIKGKIILELANGPTTPEAQPILDKAWIEVLPDILANAWWVTVSYFEQVQNNANYYRPEDEVFEKLEKIMNKATNWVIATAQQHETNLRDAAYIVAIERLLEAMQFRGR